MRSIALIGNPYWIEENRIVVFLYIVVSITVLVMISIWHLMDIFIIAKLETVIILEKPVLNANGAMHQTVVARAIEDWNELDLTSRMPS